MDIKTVTLRISSRSEVRDRFSRASVGEPQGSVISFESPTTLFAVLTGKRWELLRMMTGGGPMTIREASRRLQRDVKAVHGDVQTLLKVGILRRTEQGRIVFPFDAVHVDFMLRAA